MPQIYEGLVQRGERLPAMFQEGLESGRAQRHRRGLGALMAAGDMEKAQAYAYEQGLLDEGAEIQSMRADQAQAQQETDTARREAFTGILQDVAPAIARASEIEDDAQRGEAIATITATTAQMHPQLASEIEQYGEQLYGLPREQLQFAAQAMGYEAQGGDLTTLGQQLVEAGYQPGTPDFQQAMRERIQRSGQQINVNTQGDRQPVIRSGDEIPGADPGKTYQLRQGTGGSEYWDEIGLSPSAREGEEEREAAAAEAQERAGDAVAYQQAYDAANMLEDVDRLLGLTNDDMTGLMGATLGSFWGTPQYSYAAQLDSIKGRIALDALTQMREAARATGNTGSGLGQVTEREIRILQATEGALDQAQSADDLRRVLTRMRDSMRLVEDSRLIHMHAQYPARARQLYGEGHGTPQNPFRPNEDADHEAIPAGMVYVDPDDGQLYTKE